MRNKFLVAVLVVATGTFFAWQYFNRATIKTLRPFDTTKPFILFDFDGTLVDSFDTVLEVYNEVAGNVNAVQISPAEKAGLRHLHMKEILAKFKVPWHKVPFLRTQVIKGMSKYITHLQMVPGISEVLEALKVQEYTLGIVTSNSEALVRNVLASNGINVFDVIYEDHSMFGKHHVIKRFLNTFNLSPARVIYVGDEVRDIEAAHKAGIKVLAVTWGFNAQELLLKASPDGLAQAPAMLPQAIKALL